MSFLGRLFNKKHTVLKRSNTGPQSSSSDDEADEFNPVAVPVRMRRPAGDYATSRTNVAKVSQDGCRSSMSSTADHVDDAVKSKYKGFRSIHRGRGCTIIAAQERASKQPVIMKAYPKGSIDENAQRRLDNELQLLREVAGFRGVVRLLNHVEDDDFKYIVLEHCPGVSLIELVANNKGWLPEPYCASEVAIPLLQTVAALHAHGCVHRNLKPEHVICGPGCSVRLIDFTDAANKRNKCLNDRTGAMEYGAPELLAKPTTAEVFHKVLYNGMEEEELPQYDEKADVFSIGAVLYEALTGYQPFLGDNLAELLALQRERLGPEQRTPDGIPQFLKQHELSPAAQSFLAATLSLDPKARLSAQELLQHPWCQNHMEQYQSRRSQSRMRRSLSEDAKGHAFTSLGTHAGGFRMATAAL